MKQIVATIFSSKLYVYTSMSLLMTGFSVVFLNIFGGVYIFVAFVLLVPIALIAGLSLLFGAYLRLAIMFAKRRGTWAERAVHVIAPLVGLCFWWMGGEAARVAVILNLSPRIERAISDVATSSGPLDDDVEVVSLKPEIAVLKTGYNPGFASPGYTHYFLLDRSGKFAELSKQGHLQELSHLPEMHRSVGAYCELEIEPWLGPYYVATRYDM